MTGNSRVHWVIPGLVMPLIFAGQVLAADVYTATAKFTNAEGKRDSATVTISIDESTPEAERAALVEQARTDPAAAKATLAGKKQLGYIEARDHRVPIRYAYVYAADNGVNVVVISDEPLGYIGGDKKSAKAKEGFDLTYAMLTLNAAGKGNGEMAPACKIKWMQSGAPAVDDYGAHVVWLEDAAKVTQP